MASADVKLKIDEQHRLYFAHTPMAALVFAIVASGFAWVIWRFANDDGVVRYLMTGFALIFVLVGVLGVFWRNELDIDLIGRHVKRRRGFWPSPKSNNTRLDAADGVRLDMEYRSSGSRNNKRKVPWWFVSIKFAGDEKGTRLFATRNEVDGYAKWEHFAKRLRLDTIDATDSGAVERKHWNDLDKNVSEQEEGDFEGPLRDPNPPLKSGLQLVQSEGRREIRIVAPGFNGGLVFLIIFGGIFVALGSFTGLSALGVIDVPVSGSKTALVVIPPIFIILGLGIIWLGVKGSYSTQVIAVKNGELFTETLAFGRRSGRTAVPLAKIESVGIGGDVSSKRRRSNRVKIGGVALGNSRYRKREDEVVVRSDGQILRFGRSLDDSARIWLENACRYAVVNGKLP